MLYLGLLYLALAAFDVWVTSKILPSGGELNPVTNWLNARMKPLYAAAVSVGIPSVLIVAATVHFDAVKTLCVLIGIRLALFYSQLYAHRDILWS